MEYSNEFLARVYGAYMGCQFTYRGSLGVIRVVSGITREFHILDSRNAQDGNDSYRPDRCQLLLTHLSAISDEHAIEVAKMRGLGFHEDPLYKLYIGRGIVAFHLMNYTPYDDSKYDTAISRKHITNLHPHVFVQICDYLRTQGYDCGYAEIPSLIDAGLAIDKTTLNN